MTMRLMTTATTREKRAIVWSSVPSVEQESVSSYLQEKKTQQSHWQVRQTQTQVIKATKMMNLQGPGRAWNYRELKLNSQSNRRQQQQFGQRSCSGANGCSGDLDFFFLSESLSLRLVLSSLLMCSSFSFPFSASACRSPESRCLLFFLSAPVMALTSSLRWFPAFCCLQEMSRLFSSTHHHHQPRLIVNFQPR